MESFDDRKASRPAIGANTKMDPKVKTMPPVPQQPKKPSYDEIVKMISDVKSFRLALSVKCQREGPKDLLPAKGALVTNMMAWTTGRQDSVFYMVLQQVAIERKIPDKEISRVLKYVDSVIWSGGTVQGLFHRLKQGLDSGECLKLDVNRDKVFNWLKKALPIDFEKLPDLSKTSALVDMDPDINYKTSAGCPFLGGVRKAQFSLEQKDASAAKMWLAWAEQIAGAADSFEKFQKFYRENEDMFALEIANKYALLKRDELQVKARAYYKAPAALSFLEQVYIQPLQDALAGFWENKESISAFRFSWANGGIRRLQRWAQNAPQGFSALIYGDDHFHIFKFGKLVYVSAPDCWFMDMSMIPDWGWVFGGYVLRSYAHKFSERWKNILSAHVKTLFGGKVIIEGSLCVLKDTGLNSGKVGTSLAGQVASALTVFEFKSCEAEGLKAQGVGGLQVWSEGVWKRISTKLGLRLKPGTGKWLQWDVDNQPFPAKFLGYTGKIVQFPAGKGVEKHWLPIKPREEWFAALSYLKNDSHDGLDRTPPLVLRLSSLFGCYFSGGYADSWVAEAIKRVYAYLRDTPGAGFKASVADIDDSLFDLAYLQGKIPWLPDRLELARFYANEEKVELSKLVTEYKHSKGKTLSRAQQMAFLDPTPLDELQDLTAIVGPSPQVVKLQIPDLPSPPQAEPKHVGKVPPDLVKKKMREDRKKKQEKQTHHIVEKEERDRDKRAGIPHDEEDLEPFLDEDLRDFDQKESKDSDDEDLAEEREKERNRRHDEIVKKEEESAEVELDLDLYEVD
jgi:hypothetical protein